MLRIALLHDYLVQDGGAERVLAALQELFPEAPTYTLLYDKRHPQAIQRDVRGSFLQTWPFANRLYQWYMPFMAMAAESLDVKDVDLVISTSSSFAKGVILPPEVHHICYCHTPTRFLWQERFGYAQDLSLPRLFRSLLPRLFHSLRTWDVIAAARPNLILTNSVTSRNRIKQYYHRDATVLFPPVDIERITPKTTPGTHWVAGGRLVAYKRFDLIVEAFNTLGLPLIIFGTGPEEQRLRRVAQPHIRFTGYVDEEEKIELMRNAIAFLHPQIEDFGITAVEAMAAGRPVITNAKGGGAETVIDGVTGTHVAITTAQDIVNAVRTFDGSRFDPAQIRARAETFSKKQFQEEIQRLCAF